MPLKVLYLWLPPWLPPIHGVTAQLPHRPRSQHNWMGPELSSHLLLLLLLLRLLYLPVFLFFLLPLLPGSVATDAWFPTQKSQLKRKLNCGIFSRKSLLVTDRWLCADCDKRMWLRWKFHNSHTQKSKRLTFSKFGKGCVWFSRTSCLCGWVLHRPVCW